MSLSSFSAGTAVISKVARKWQRTTGARLSSGATPATMHSTLTRACRQFVGFAQLGIADFDPSQPIAPRRGKQQDIVEPGACGGCDRAGEQADGPVYRPRHNLRQNCHTDEEGNGRTERKQCARPATARRL